MSLCRLLLALFLAASSGRGQLALTRADHADPTIVAAHFALEKTRGASRNLHADLSATSLTVSAWQDCRLLIRYCPDSAAPIHPLTNPSQKGVRRQDPRGNEHQLYLRPDSSLEWEIVLEKPPRSGRLSFSIALEGLTACYQPPLTAKEKEDQHERPDSVVGSYAFYQAKPPGDKAFHLYRPRVVDARGAGAWCDLQIDDSMTIVVPDSFLKAAAYPVRVDPTFGSTSAGASSFAMSTTRCYGNKAASSRHVASTGDIVDSFSVYARTSSGNQDTVDIALYSWQSGLVNRLDTACWAIITSATGSWSTTGRVTHALQAGVEYTLAVNHHEGTPRMYYDAGSSGDNGFTGDTDLPAVWYEEGGGNYILSAYCYYHSTAPATGKSTRRRRLQAVPSR